MAQYSTNPSPILLLRKLQRIQVGDMITAITQAHLLASSKDFVTPTISAMAPGTFVYLTTYRDGQAIGISVTLGSSKCP